MDMKGRQGVFVARVPPGSAQQLGILEALCACVDSADWRQALALVDQGKLQGSVATSTAICRLAVLACAVADEPGKGIALLRAGDHRVGRGLDGLKKVQSALAVLRSCERTGLWQEALEGLPFLMPRGGELEIPRPSAVTYNAVISACGRGRQWAKAMGLLQEMQRVELEPDVISYGSAVRGLQASFAVGAAELLLDLRARGLQPSQEACHSAVSAASASWQRAVALLGEIRLVRLMPGLVGYNAAIDACRQARNPQWALKLLEQLERMPSETPDTLSYAAAIGACCDYHGRFSVLGCLPRLCHQLESSAVGALRSESQ
ncbi:unnamed protein product [Polarella glacialis]|uniref:Pentatricopeptide repeat-containing protein, chloroplastic n=1 Tax=Polarella glacialis TaxID=89957 RepID=A0A813ILF7_POLGL|nr:unnamed protein product [Polarella glacialis]